MELTVGILGIVFLLLLLVIGMPIAFALALSGAVGIMVLGDWSMAFNFLSRAPYTATAVWVYIIVPLFILMGNLAFSAGISTEAYSAAHKWLYRIPGGLAMSTIVASAGFAAVCGSSVAACAAIGKAAIPEMRRFGYHTNLILGSVGSGGTLAIMIPPSGTFVIYGIITEQSIGKLLLAGFLPGLLLGLILCVGILIMVLRNPNLAPRINQTITWVDRMKSTRGATPILLLFLLVIGGLYMGIFTATEAAAVGTAAALIMLLVRSRQRGRDLRAGMVDAAKTTCMVFAIIIGANLFSLFITMAGIPQALTQSLINLNLPTALSLALLLLPYIPLGMFLEPVSMLFLTLPIMYPVAIGLGFDGIWFGVLVVMLIEVGMLTPPVGLNVFVLGSLVPEVPISRIFRAFYPFLAFYFLALVTVAVFPDIALFLPRMMMG